MMGPSGPDDHRLDWPYPYRILPGTGKRVMSIPRFYFQLFLIGGSVCCRGLRHHPLNPYRRALSPP